MGRSLASRTSDDRIPLPRGAFIYAFAAVAMPPARAAAATGLSVAEYLRHVEAWAEGPGLPYGLVVDREAGTITRLGDRAENTATGGPATS